MQELIQENKKAPRRLYYWGLLGLFPNVGLICGIVLSIRGIFQYRDYKLVLVGFGDILFTLIFWMAFNYYTTHSSTFQKLDMETTQGQLNTLFKTIEFYKVENGVYPDSLEQLKKDDKTLSIYDFMTMSSVSHKMVLYNYSKSGQKYHLFSSGLDGIPNTSDDIYPQMRKEDTAKFGLILK